MLRRIAGYDTPLVVATLGIVGLGIYVLLTAISGTDGTHDNGYGVKQAIFAAVGLALAVGTSRIDIGFFERRWMMIWAGTVGSILLVFLVGSVARGSRRWIDVGFFNVQPSEMGKILVILAVAGFIVTRMREIGTRSMVAAVLALAGIPGLLVFLQPDLGTAQMYAVAALGLLYFAGARWTHLGGLVGGVVAMGVAVLIVLPAVGVHVLHDYQIKRLTGFANPEADPQGANYHAVQSKIAIGSGGLTGKPAEEATQVRKAFLPEPQTDFIFATLGERHGVLGGALLLGLFLLLISRCLRATAIAPTAYGRLVCGAMAVLITAQVFVNVGMTIGIMPITGVPLPLFSYGGSALLANLFGIGLVAGVFRSAEAAPVRSVRRRTRVSTGSIGGSGHYRPRRTPVGSGQVR